MILCLSFFAWLTTLSISLYSSIHVVTNGTISFFIWLNNIPPCVFVYVSVWLYIAQFLYLFIHQWKQVVSIPCIINMDTLFCCTSVYCVSQILSFILQVEGLWQPHFSKSVSSVSPTAFAHFISLCHILAIFVIFETFSLLLYLLWGSTASDL